MPHAARRWFIALAGTVLQLCLGTVYAWSYLQNPLIACFRAKQVEVNNSQVMGIFSLTIFALGLSAAWGGTQLPRLGPRRLAVAGGCLFGAGYLLAALASRQGSLVGLYFSYGLVGGVGLGLGYVTPVATVAKWFPDKKGLLTGMVIMGFGFGALLMSKVVMPPLDKWAGGDLAAVFAVLGAGFLVIVLPAAWMLTNPPAGYAPHEAPKAAVPVELFEGHRAAGQLAGKAQERARRQPRPTGR